MTYALHAAAGSGFDLGVAAVLVARGRLQTVTRGRTYALIARLTGRAAGIS
jgi:hypothetical protein